MIDVVDSILRIIENPLIEKGYRDLKKYYESVNMANEAAAIGDLIAKRFPSNNHSPSSEK